MTLSFIPAGNDQVASSRIRVYCLLNALRRRKVGVSTRYDRSADVLIVQKRVTGEILEAVREFKRLRKPVIYDCDDIGPVLEAWAPAKLRREMIRSADLVTTNSAGFRNALLGRYRARKVAIIPDAIDYYLKKPIRRTIRPSSPLRLLWFGNQRNLRLLEKYAAVLQAIPRCHLCVCTNLSALFSPKMVGLPDGRPLGRHPSLKAFGHHSISLVEWKVDTFPALLHSCDLSFLPHDGGAEDRAKGSNRMVASIAWGTPAIASRTTAYEDTARKMGVPDCLFDRPEDVPALVEMWRGASSRQRYLTLAQPWVGKNHSADVVAEKLCWTIASHLQMRRSEPPRRKNRG
jgi:hypothetical protein